MRLRIVRIGPLRRCGFRIVQHPLTPQSFCPRPPRQTRNENAPAATALSKINAADSLFGFSQDETTWNDSCLGCPQTGENCAQVVTPGYRIVLRVSDATYEYHTDLGGRATLCSQTGGRP
jgi:hypothetical protein